MNYYILFPNSKQLSKGIDLGIENCSLITSVSDSFQKKNINRSLDETKEDLYKSFDLINMPQNNYISKDYILIFFLFFVSY